MLDNELKSKLKTIICGTAIDWQNDHCTAIRNYLCRSFSPSTKVKEDFEGKLIVKKEQADYLTDYITQNNLWGKKPEENIRLLTVGGEAEVYIDIAKQRVIKVNDAVYYATWLDYFTSILIHNLLFAETNCQLLGFTKRGNDLQVILQQQYIVSDAPVNLKDVRELLAFNGFENTVRNDYYNPEFGIILEDIHDENVIVNSGYHFFIDTVFYVNITD